ncbi:MAG: permease prefix domain 1-containing protein, partial [Blastocatellia bacterium]
ASTRLRSKMNSLNPTTVMNRVRALFTRSKKESDLDDELSFHLEMKTRDNIEAGMVPGQASHEARPGSRASL